MAIVTSGMNNDCARVVVPFNRETSSWSTSQLRVRGAKHSSGNFSYAVASYVLVCPQHFACLCSAASHREPAGHGADLRGHGRKLRCEDTAYGRNAGGGKWVRTADGVALYRVLCAGLLRSQPGGSAARRWTDRDGVRLAHS